MRIVLLGTSSAIPTLTRGLSATAVVRVRAEEILGTAGELGQEGFQTSLRLAGSTIGEVKRLDFQRPSRDD